MDFLIIKEESEQGFEKIARKLFNEYAIQTRDTLYRLTEIEFYWNSKTHYDASTYERKQSILISLSKPHNFLLPIFSWYRKKPV